ncbi:MAG: hypothetical protein EXS10_04345 [Phycisphaerales bacterium]|nr:hypothetical protein [Phycisphaerales bacterium]
MGWRPPIQPQAASYGPSLQLFFALLAVGASVAWPLLRLSGPPLPPIRQSLFDAAVIATMVQLILWPARLLSLWSVERAALLDLACIAVLATTMSLLACCMASTQAWQRAAWMLLFVVIALLPADWVSMRTQSAFPAPAIANASLVYAIAQSDPSRPSDELRQATRDGLVGASLLTAAALAIGTLRRLQHRNSTSQAVCASEKVV